MNDFTFIAMYLGVENKLKYEGWSNTLRLWNALIVGPAKLGLDDTWGRSFPTIENWLAYKLSTIP